MKIEECKRINLFELKGGTVFKLSGYGNFYVAGKQLGTKRQVTNLRDGDTPMFGNTPVVAYEQVEPMKVRRV